MKNKSVIYSAVLAGLLIAILFSCKKEEAPKVIPTVKSKSVTGITAATASGGGEVTSEGGVPVTLRGVCWSTNQNPTTADSKTSDGTGPGSFTSSITGLSPGVTYYLRAYAINTIGTSYSSQISFGALALLPVLSTVGLSNITTTTASSGGNITSDGGAAITARGVCWSTLHNPLITDNKTNDGTGTGNFTSAITGLNINTTYYVRAYATNAVGTVYGSENSVIFYLNVPDAPVTDIDGNIYSTVKIGTQVWMTENLKTTKYRNGDPIPNVTDQTAWLALVTGAYCNYDDDPNKAAVYGRLYNWYAVADNRNLAPTGWHIPSRDEWRVLSNFLGGSAVSGGKLKETGLTHWLSPNTGATNESGFNALPAGLRTPNMSFNALGGSTYWWTSTTSTDFNNNAYFLAAIASIDDLAYDTDGGHKPKSGGLSVRCVKD